MAWNALIDRGREASIFRIGDQQDGFRATSRPGFCSGQYFLDSPVLRGIVDDAHRDRRSHVSECVQTAANARSRVVCNNYCRDSQKYALQ